MRIPIETNGTTIETTLYAPVPVALTERVTFFIIRGYLEVGADSFWNMYYKLSDDLLVYSDDTLKIHDYRRGADSRILSIAVNKPDVPECAFDFYGGDLIIIPGIYDWEAYVFIPYLNLFYLVGNITNTAKWMECSNKFRCIAGVHSLCSQLLLLKNGEDPDVILRELRNLHKLVNAWTASTDIEKFDWQHEAKKLLDSNVVPKIKKFAVNSNYRRMRLD